MTRHSLVFTLAATAVLPVTLLAQSTIAPAGTAPAGDAGSIAALPGLDHAGRSQILIDASQLGAVRGRVVRSLALRRDTAGDFAFLPGAADLEVRLSIAPRPAHRAASAFDANFGGIQLAFAGTVSLPASASPAGRTTGFGVSGDVVEIPLQNPFAYNGGTLCIDIQGRPSPGQATTWWPVDAVVDPVQGDAVRVGAPCGRTATAAISGTATALSAYPTTLVAGSSTSFGALGTPGAMGAMLIGLTPTDIDLNGLGLGAPGCRLLVLDAFAVAGTFRNLGPAPIGSLDIDVSLPTQAAVPGSTFRIQAVEFGGSITTSEAIDCTIASSLPALGMALIRAEGDGTTVPATGSVETWRAPVVRFGF